MGSRQTHLLSWLLLLPLLSPKAKATMPESSARMVVPANVPDKGISVLSVFLLFAC